MIDYLKVKMSEIHSRFPDIRQGGCGAFALLLYNQLRLQEAEPKIMLIGHRKMKPMPAMEHIERAQTIEEIFRFFYFYHITLFLNGHYLDSTGAYPSLKELRKAHFLGRFCSTLEIPVTLLMNIQNDSEWNSQYDTKQTEEIEQTLKEVFTLEQPGVPYKSYQRV